MKIYGFEACPLHPSKKKGRRLGMEEIEYQLRDHWEGLIDDQLEQPDYWTDDWSDFVFDEDEWRRTRERLRESLRRAGY